MEKVLDDLNVDTKFTSNIKDYWQEICLCWTFPTELHRNAFHTAGSLLVTASIKSFRWLTIYMFCIILGCQKLTDICKDELNALYTKHSVTEISRKRLVEIQRVLQVKSLTEKGKERKSRLVENLIEQRENFLLIANRCFCFTAVEISRTFSPSRKQKHPSHSWSDGRQF